MTCYLGQPRHQIFVKSYGFLSFARNMGKNISKNVSSKYSQKLLDHAKQSVKDALKTVSKTSPQNNSETNEEEILRKRHISPKERQNMIDDLRLI